MVSYFNNDGSQKYLKFQQVFKYFQISSGTIDHILGWESKGLSEEGITTPARSNNSLHQNLPIFIIPK